MKSNYRYADIVDVGDSVLIEKQKNMVPAKVEHIRVHTNEGIHDTNFKTLLYNAVIDQHNYLCNFFRSLCSSDNGRQHSGGWSSGFMLRLF